MLGDGNVTVFLPVWSDTHTHEKRKSGSSIFSHYTVKIWEEKSDYLFTACTVYVHINLFPNYVHLLISLSSIVTKVHVNDDDDLSLASLCICLLWLFPLSGLRLTAAVTQTQTMTYFSTGFAEKEHFWCFPKNYALFFSLYKMPIHLCIYTSIH